MLSHEYIGEMSVSKSNEVADDGPLSTCFDVVMIILPPFFNIFAFLDDALREWDMYFRIDLIEEFRLSW